MILTEKNKFIVGRNQKLKKILNRRLPLNLMWLTLHVQKRGGGGEPAPGSVKFIWFTEGFRPPPFLERKTFKSPWTKPFIRP